MIAIKATAESKMAKRNLQANVPTHSFVLLNIWFPVSRDSHLYIIVPTPSAD